jgi:hypothetical protein
MPTAYILDPALRLVRSRAWGVLTAAETTHHYDHIVADPEFEPAYRQVCDLRDVERIEISSDAIRELARTAVFAPGAKRAFVATADAHFGLSRMLQAFCELEGTQVGVFRTMVEAEEWLRLDPGTLL